MTGIFFLLPQNIAVCVQLFQNNVGQVSDKTVSMLELTPIIGFILDSSCADHLFFLADEEVKWKVVLLGLL